MVGVNYKGNSSFNTNLGSWMTLITYALMGKYVIDKSLQLATRNDPTTSYNTGIIKNIDTEIAYEVNKNDSKVVNASELEFGFGIFFFDKTFKPI
jgi:hypothetical protein